MDADTARACAEYIGSTCVRMRGGGDYDLAGTAAIIRAYRDSEVAEALARQVTRIVDLTDDLSEQRARAEAAEAQVAEQANELAALKANNGIGPISADVWNRSEDVKSVLFEKIRALEARVTEQAGEIEQLRAALEAYAQATITGTTVTPFGTTGGEIDIGGIARAALGAAAGTREEEDMRLNVIRENRHGA